MHIVRALVGVDRFQIYHVAHHVELVGDTICSKHIARDAGDIERLTARIAFDDRGNFVRGVTFIFHASQPQTCAKPDTNFSHHIGELFLDQLICCKRPSELLAVENILTRNVEAILCRSQCAPGDAIASRVLAGERSL